MLRRCTVLTIVMGLLLAAPARYFASNIGPTLAVEGDHFTVDGTPKFLVFVSYFDALHGADAWATDLNYFQQLNSQQHEISGVRIFPNWFTNYCGANDGVRDTLINYDGTLNDTTLTRLKNFLTAASARGLVVDVTLTRDTVPDVNGNLPDPAHGRPVMSFEDYKTGVTSVARALLDYRNILFDVQNEYQKNGPDVSLVEQLVQAVHSVDPARIASGSRGEIAAAGTDARVHGFDFVAYHDDRTPGSWFSADSAASQLNAIRSALLPSVKPIDYQEPMPWGPFPGCATNIQQDPTPQHARQAARFARNNGAAAWTFHTRLSFKLAGTSLLARLNADPNQKAELEAATSTANLGSLCWAAAVVSLTAPGVTVASTGTTGTVGVKVNGGCQTAWSVQQSNPTWLTASPTSGNGDGTVTYTAAAQNPQAPQRVGTLTIGGRTFTVTQAASQTPFQKTVNDFDGDGRADLAVWRPSNGGWFRLLSSAGYAYPGNLTQWGSQSLGDIPMTGDMDGDRKTDLVVWRPTDGTWYWLTSSTGYDDAAAQGKPWGTQGDVPISADIDGDGKGDLVLWRPGDGKWYCLRSSSSPAYDYGGALVVQWGTQADVPIGGADMDGDGKTDLVIWRPSNGTWYWLTSSSGYAVAAANGKQWGTQGDVPMSADLDGDGKTDLVVWRPADGTWYWLTSSSGYNYAVAQGKQWGTQGDVPECLDIDGDGKSDLVVWRPGTGIWFSLTSSSGYEYAAAGQRQWGAQTDVPLPRLR